MANGFPAGSKPEIHLLDSRLPTAEKRGSIVPTHDWKVTSSSTARGMLAVVSRVSRARKLQYEHVYSICVGYWYCTTTDVSSVAVTRSFSVLPTSIHVVSVTYEYIAEAY